MMIDDGLSPRIASTSAPRTNAVASAGSLAQSSTNERDTADDKSGKKGEEPVIQERTIGDATVAEVPSPVGPDGMPSRTDGRLTNVSALSADGKPERAAAHASSSQAVRERGRAAALGAADHRAIARGIHAEVDLGEAGRIIVQAKETEGKRVDVRLDTDVAHTARALSENARDLAVDLRSESRDARVTVSGPGTQSTTTSSHSGDSGNGANRESATSRHDQEGRETRDPYAKDSTPRVGETTNPRNSRRARFVL